MPATPVSTPVAKRWAVRVLAAPYPRRRFSRFSVPALGDLGLGDDDLSALVFAALVVPWLLVCLVLWLLKLAALLLDLLVVAVLLPVRLLARAVLRW